MSLQKEGLSKFNKIYEFQYEIDGHQCDMKMTSVSGHLLNHDFEEKYRKWYSCDPVKLFELPVLKSCRDESGLKIKVYKCFYDRDSVINLINCSTENVGEGGKVRQVADYMDGLRSRGREYWLRGHRCLPGCETQLENSSCQVLRNHSPVRGASS